MKKRKNHLSTALESINKDVFRRLLFIKRNLKSQNKKKSKTREQGKCSLVPFTVMTLLAFQFLLSSEQSQGIHQHKATNQYQEPRSHSRKTRRKQEFEKTAGDRRKKIKKTNKETDSVRRHSVWRSLPRQPQPSFVVHLLFGWSSLTESLEQATDMFQFISARSLNYLYHSFSSVPLSRPRRVHR